MINWLNPRRFLLLLLLFLLAAPAAAQDADPYAALPQTRSLRGFPTLGYPSALVTVTIYGAFDDPASGEFWRETFADLLPRVQSGEIRVMFVPVFGEGSLPGGRGAARAAICASDQGRFWRYADLLFGWQTQGGDPYSGERLQSGAEELGLNNGQWITCLTGDGPDIILEDAASAANSEATFTNTPYILVNDLPSLADAESLDFTIDLELRRANDALEAELQATPEVEATEEVDTYTFDPLADDQIAPPIQIELPEGWGYVYDALVLQDLDGIRPVPFAFYQGPVTGGTGSVVLLWGFPNLVRIGGQPDVWTDATRLLRLAIFEQGCNIGTDLRRNYDIGGLQAIGTQFAAVDCPELADTRGWFAGLRQFNVNFVFYVYTSPIDAMDSEQTQDELQAILDTIQFVMPEITPEAGQ